MEKFVERTLLYDFYGELLTSRQQQVYTNVVLEDYSLSEVAQDLIRRCDKALEEYEEKLHLVDKFLNIRKQVKRIHQIAEESGIEEIAAISNVILEEL